MGKFMLMPKLDMSMEEGVIVAWLVNKGDEVAKGDMVVEVETGKVNLEVDNTAAAGTVLEFYAEAGDSVKVNEPILYIGEAGEVPPPASSAKPAVPAQRVAPSGETAPEDSAPPADFDLAVVGAGPGGYVAAIRAAQLGARVVLFEEERVGGVCLNRGCIPTKALIKSGEVWRQVREAEDHGITVTKASFDWEKIMARKEKVVRRLTSGVESLLMKNGVTLVKERALLEGAGGDGPALLRAGGKNYTAGKVILAAGSGPASLPLAGDGSIPVYTPESILSLDPLPGRLLVIGGGVIGCEMAGLYASFGVEVTVAEMLPGILPGADGEIRDALAGALTAEGVTLRLGTTVTEVKAHKAFLSDGTELETEAILIAVGRRPPEGFPESCVDPSLNIALEGRGWIDVNPQGETSLPGVYAIGDIIGGVQLAHAASAEGTALAHRLFGDGVIRPLGPVPSCVFTSPEAAWIGLSEEEAEGRGLPVKIGRFPFAALGKAVSAGETEGFIKVITDSRWDEILGIHIFGAGASALIGQGVALLGLEATAEEVTRMIHPHPTLTEGFLEACEGVGHGAIHI